MKKLTFILATIVILGGCTQAFEYKAPQETGCEYNGLRYRYGEIFPASDGCNECTCANDGTVTCSENTCGNPAQCQTDEDCQTTGIDTSFCTDGSWTCQKGQCDFSCSL